MNTNETILGIVTDLESYKASRAALDEMIAAKETALLSYVNTKDEGAAKTIIGDVEITVTGRINRKLDIDEFDKIKEDLPASYAKKVVKYKPSLDLRTLRAMQEHDADAYGMMARCITATPGKPAIKIELHGEEE